MLIAFSAVLPAGAPLTRPLAVRPAGDGSCSYPAPQFPGTPWSLQRLLLDQMWQYTQGQGVKVAVIDTGVDPHNPQLHTAVDQRDGVDLIDPAGDGTDDTVGHGTQVAGIIAARPARGTGFVGLAPQATIIPIRQNDDRGSGTPASLAVAVRRAVDAGASVINISQQTATGADAELAAAIQWALAKDVVVVAAAGNNGANGARHTTYPAAYPGVLAVGASDRAGERAGFSQAGDFVGVVAPGVDMVSTVPFGGQCADSGTSFSAPYAAAIAALIRAKHPDWKEYQVVTQIEQTADRVDRGRNDSLGWGVVDPVRALTDDARPADQPTADSTASRPVSPAQPAGLAVGETARQRAERAGTYAVGAAMVLLALVTGGAVVARDVRRRRGDRLPTRAIAPAHDRP